MASAKGILEEINKLRENPPAYAEKVLKYVEYFKGAILKVPGTNISVRTSEGDVPYKETAEYLKGEAPREPMTGSKALCEICKEFLEKIKDSDSGDIDEGEAEALIDKHGNFNGKFTRAMDFGGFSDEQIVINLMVCDGESSRSQRVTVMDAGLKKIGCAFGKHSLYQTAAIICSATDFENTVDSDDTPIFESPEEEDIEKEKQRALEEEQERERQKAELEKQEQERQKAELEKQEQEKKEQERQRAELEKQEQEKKQKEQKEKEQKEKEEKEKEKQLEKEKAEEAKKEAERLKEEELAKKKAKLEAEQKEKEKAKKEIKFPKRTFKAVNKLGEEQLPEGVIAMTKSDRITFKGGKRIKITTYVKTLKDGSKVTEDKEEILEY